MSTTSCTEFQRRLTDAVESSDSTAYPALREHAESCPGCRKHWQQHLLLERAVADWRARVPKADLADAVLARHAFEQASARPSASTAAQAAAAGSGARRQAWSSVAVAMLAVAATVWILVRTPDAPRTWESANSPHTTAQAPTAPVDVEADDAELEVLVADAGSAYLLLANQAAEALVDVSRVVAPPRIALLTVDQDEPQPRESSDWRNDLQPIGREFGKALGFLFDAVPGDSPPST